MRRPDALLFDLWGTLIASEGFDPGRGNAAVLKHCENPRGVPLAAVQDLGRRVVSAIEPREEQSALEFTQVSLLRIIADTFALRFPGGIEEAEWIFWDAALRIRVIDGIVELLPALAALGIRMGVVSNSSFVHGTLERELERQGIRRQFQLVISSADYGIRKPDPLLFEVALARMGCVAERAWFAGDNVGYDIVGASGAGLFPVAYNPRSPVPSAVGPHAVIKRWSELLSLVTSAEPASALS